MKGYRGRVIGGVRDLTLNHRTVPECSQREATILRREHERCK